jgi:cell division protein FtsI/penicillin-binding protein 2
MTRRHAAALLLGAGARGLAAAPKKLGPVIGDIPGAALLVDVRTRALIAVHGADLAGGLLVPPGSAIKPFTIEALSRGGKLRDGEVFACPGTLAIGARSFNCSHPTLAQPIDTRTALAYSCNCFAAHFAERFAPGELAAHLVRCGLSSRSGWLGEGEGSGRVERATSREAQQLQAIGEGGVLVTAAAMALAYQRLARRLSEDPPGPSSDAIRSGLEGAVEFGTAQRAGVAGARVAGKTGSVRAPDGAMFAWFCGFAPSRAASVAVTVMLAGRSGGADAAPVAARILEAHFAGRL